jgi:hypothetical protein
VHAGVPHLGAPDGSAIRHGSVRRVVWSWWTMRRSVGWWSVKEICVETHAEPQALHPDHLHHTINQRSLTRDMCPSDR